jgi:hypothetical protein
MTVNCICSSADHPLSGVSSGLTEFRAAAGAGVGPVGLLILDWMIM